MRSFRLWLIFALILGVTLISAVSTYFEVLAHKHALRQELQRRTEWLARNLKTEIESALASGNGASLVVQLNRIQKQNGTLGLAVYDTKNALIASVGQKDVLQALSNKPIEKVLERGTESAAFDHAGNWQWLQEVVPLRVNQQAAGAFVIVEDAAPIREEAYGTWQRSFWRTLLAVILIVGVTLLTVRWFLMQPMRRAVERLRHIRLGHGTVAAEEAKSDLSLFMPLACEMETMAESLAEARAAAVIEARLRNAGEHLWTAERLAVHLQDRSGSSRIFAVSNREPYMHIQQGKKISCEVPASGLVTAIEPVLRACDGVWVAHGSGSGDKQMVDASDRLRVPPEDPRYSLRRVWLSPEEEQGYYDGFANEGLWPLCHIAYTRPVFRASDWDYYRRVNEKFAMALLEEMQGCQDPVVFVQDYHFTLLPQLIKTARPDARIAIFWHIPWPNPEAFGICPWQADLLDGLLGADLIGFHIPLHCNNFLATVDRALESRTNREQMTVERNSHTTVVRSYPISVSLEGMDCDSASTRTPQLDYTQNELLQEYGVQCVTMAVGVDRLDYTKGIVERMLAIEQLLEEHPWHLERLTFVQIAAPSRTRIPSYVELRRKVEETVERINLRFKTQNWRPIVLIDKHCNHEQVNRWYRVADICMVTSLHDGMNLVAKEFVAAREDEDGVLILSKFTGAAVELHDALIINPYDIHGMAEAIHSALEMPREERRDRMRRMRTYVKEHNIYRWASRILDDLFALRLENQEMLLTNASEENKLEV